MLPFLRARSVLFVQARGFACSLHIGPKSLKGSHQFRLTGLTTFLLCGGIALNRHPRQAICEHKINSGQQLIVADELQLPRKKSKSNMALLVSLLTTYDWILFGLSAFCSVLASLMTTAQARVIGKLFDSMGKASALEGGLTKLLAVFVLQAALSFASATSLSVAVTNLGVRLRVSFFSSIIKQDMAILDEKKTGELTHQLSQDVAALQTAVRESFTRGVEGVTSLLSGSFLLYSVSPSMSFYLLGLLPVGAFAGTFLGEALRSLSQKSREASNRATGLASESISNVRTIRAFAAEERETSRYMHELNTGASLKTQMAAYSGAFYSGVGLGINLTTLFIVGWGHQLIAQGVLTKGDIATIATQVQMLERSLARLSVLSASLSKAMKSSEHIFDTIKRRPVVNCARDHPVCLQKEFLRGDVALENIKFSYPSRKDALVLDRFSIVANHGEVVALVGASGSGKSTVFALVERFYDPDGGRVLLDGTDIRELDPQWLRQTIGYVPQKPELFSGTVAENIRYGNLHATQSEVEEAAKRANAHDFIKAFPRGYDTVLGQEGLGISGGQKQRIAIARTLLLDPKVLLLDEITSGLDSESEYLVGKALDELMKGRTTVVIAHRLNTVKNASRIYVVEDGQVIESGTHDELVHKDNGAYRAFWDRQNRGLRRSNTQKHS